jgi:hypothetical protein
MLVETCSVQQLVHVGILVYPQIGCQFTGWLSDSTVRHQPMVKLRKAKHIKQKAVLLFFHDLLDGHLRHGLLPEKTVEYRSFAIWQMPTTQCFWRQKTIFKSMSQIPIQPDQLL